MYEVTCNGRQIKLIAAGNPEEAYRKSCKGFLPNTPLQITDIYTKESWMMTRTIHSNGPSTVNIL